MLIGFSQSIRGRSHILSDRPCQDSSGYRRRNRYIAGAVADGHGSRVHIRSDIGSHLAVECALDVIDGYLDDIGTFWSILQKDRESLLERIKRTIVAEWNDRITQYEQMHPETEEERNEFHQFNIVLPQQDFIRKYGTTLLVGVMSDYFSICLQIGDGDVVILDDHGKMIQPMPDDPDCFINVTTSLCQSDVMKSFRHYVGGRIAGLCLSTDGLSTTFHNTESFKRNDLAYLSLIDDEGSQERIIDNLRLRSESNRMDDVSLTMLYDPGVLGKICIESDNVKFVVE